MHRSFTLALPADALFRNLYALMLLITGATPTDGILPDRGCQLIIKADPGNTTAIHVSDRNSANSAGVALLGAEGIAYQSSRNSICFRDYTLQGDAAGVRTVQVEIECI